MGRPLHQGIKNYINRGVGGIMEVEEMLKAQEALVEACGYLEIKSEESLILKSNTRKGIVDLENYNSLINVVVARLTRQVIRAKRHLDRLV